MGVVRGGEVICGIVVVFIVSTKSVGNPEKGLFNVNTEKGYVQ